MIAGVVQRAAQRAGLDPREFAGHSLRAGFASEAAAQGASERAIMRQTGHRSVEMVRRYIREGDRYRDNARPYWVCSGRCEAAASTPKPSLPSEDD